MALWVWSKGLEEKRASLSDQRQDNGLGAPETKKAKCFVQMPCNRSKDSPYLPTVLLNLAAHGKFIIVPSTGFSTVV